MTIHIDLSTNNSPENLANRVTLKTFEDNVIISGKYEHAHSFTTAGFISGKTHKHIKLFSVPINAGKLFLNNIHVNRYVIIQPAVQPSGGPPEYVSTLLTNYIPFFNTKIYLGGSSNNYLSNYIPDYTLNNPAIDISNEEFSFKEKNEKLLELTSGVPIDGEYKIKSKYDFKNTSNYLNIYYEENYTRGLTTGSPVNSNMYECFTYFCGDEANKIVSGMLNNLVNGQGPIYNYNILFYINFKIEGKYIK